MNVYNTPTASPSQKMEPTTEFVQKPWVNLIGGFSGSVATIKDYQMIKQLKEIPNLNIRCVYTQSGTHFKHSSAKKIELFK